MMKSVIFFDCFNTLINRSLSPNEVLFDFAVRLGEVYSVEPAYLYRLFTGIKRRLAVGNKLHTGESELKFGQILDGMLPKLKKYLPDLREDDFRAQAEACYFEAEKQTHSLVEGVSKRVHALTLPR